MLTYRLSHTITGEPIGMPVYAPGSWTQSLTKAGSGVHRLVIPSVSAFRPSQWHAATSHWWCSLEVAWGETPMYRGLIADKVWDYNAQALTIQTVTIEDLLASRFPFGVSTYSMGDFTVVGQTLRAALAQAIRRGAGGAWGATWPLPFDYVTPLSEPGPFSREWLRHGWTTIADIIKLIQGLDGGPDLAFIPTRSPSGWARYDVLIGDPNIPGPTIDVPLSVRRPRARRPRRREDGRLMRSGEFDRGSGAGEDRPFGEAGFLAGPPMPTRDTSRSIADVNDVATLTSLAEANLKRHRAPTTQHEFELLVDDGPNPIDVRKLRLGTRMSLRHSGDGYTDPFSETNYVVALSHDANDWRVFRPEVQPL